MKTNNTETEATGRALSCKAIRAHAGRRAKAAIDALAKVASDDAAPPADRVRAAEILLSHSTAGAAA
ncbi:MAG: hypothetical protein WA056_01625 [Gallionella sp.]